MKVKNFSWKCKSLSKSLLGYKGSFFPHHSSLQDLYFDNTATFSLQHQFPQLEKAEKLMVQKNKDAHFI